MIPVDVSIPPLRLPPQSSRFFPPAPSRTPNIIAVDSSPERGGSSGSGYIPHQSHFAQQAYGVNSYNQQRGGIYQDPFSASTLIRPSSRIRPAGQDAYEPPRKKQNLGHSSNGIILVEDSPESSPQARFTGSTRTVLTSPLVDDEDSPGPNRLRRGRPGEGMYPPESPSAYRMRNTGTMMIRTSLMNAFPSATEEEVERSLQLSRGDFNAASGIIHALVQGRERSHSISIAAQQEQQRKEKELAKQRKNKSAIYANRAGAAPTQATPLPTKRNNDDSDSDEDDFKGDGFDSDASDAEDRTKDSELEAICTIEALEYFNTADAEGLVMMIGMLRQQPLSNTQLTCFAACTPEQADIIIKMRPFLSVDDVERKMVRRTGVSAKLFENYKDLMKGYRAVDAVLQRCERIGQDIDETLGIWEKNAGDRPKPKVEQNLYLVDGPSAVPPLRIRSPLEIKAMDAFIWDAPKALAKGITLKEYQMLGLNWLNLLHSRGHSCILADEMGEYHDT